MAPYPPVPEPKPTRTRAETPISGRQIANSVHIPGFYPPGWANRWDHPGSFRFGRAAGLGVVAELGAVAGVAR